MRRRYLISLASALATVSATVRRVRAQPQRVYRIGYLAGGLAARGAPAVAGFRQALNELGYSDTSFVIISRYANGKFETLPALVQELLTAKPDILLVATTPANLAASAATRTTPIVMVNVADPVGVGLVQSLSKPGGNITGVTNIAAELLGKRLELLRELVPGLTKVAVLYNPDDTIAAPQLSYLRRSAPPLQIDLGPLQAIRKAADVEPAFAAAGKEAQAAVRLTDPLVNALGALQAEMALKHRVPTIYPFREVVSAGGLISYGTNLLDQYRQAATYVHKILQGARPAELPVQQPTRFEMVVNLQSAKALGLSIPPSILARADEVIE